MALFMVNIFSMRDGWFKYFSILEFDKIFFSICDLKSIVIVIPLAAPDTVADGFKTTMVILTVEGETVLLALTLAVGTFTVILMALPAGVAAALLDTVAVTPNVITEIVTLVGVAVLLLDTAPTGDLTWILIVASTGVAVEFLDDDVEPVA